jgi:deoxyribonuclease-4
MQKDIPADELLIGAHTSIAGGVHLALLAGKSIGATTIQIFTANQRRWLNSPIKEENVVLWHETLKETGLKKIMSHDSYLINLGAPNAEILEKSRIAFKEEIDRCHQLGINFLNFHPGAALTESSSECMDRICESIVGCEDLLSKGSLRLLLESTAGQGSVIGSRFEELAYMIHKLEKHVRIGVCIDTCHAFVAGYDLRTAEACDATLIEFDRVVGLKHLYAFHLNDSLKGLGSHVDRHSSLGKGTIGIECFKFLMSDSRTRDIPKYLETPEGMEVWKDEIALLRKFASES